MEDRAHRKSEWEGARSQGANTSQCTVSTVSTSRPLSIRQFLYKNGILREFFSKWQNPPSFYWNFGLVLPFMSAFFGRVIGRRFWDGKTPLSPSVWKKSQMILFSFLISPKSSMVMMVLSCAQGRRRVVWSTLGFLSLSPLLHTIIDTISNSPFPCFSKDKGQS